MRKADQRCRLPPESPCCPKMSEIIHQKVSVFDIPALEPYRTLKSQGQKQGAEIFVAEGEKVVRRLIESPITLISLLLPEKWLRVYEPVLRARPEPSVSAFTAEKAVLEELTGCSMYQGVLAVGCVPTGSSLDVIWSTSGRTSPRLFLAVEGLANGENLGGIIRTAFALGVDGLIIGETCCHPYLRRSVRGSMGTLFKLAFHISPKLPDTLLELGRRGCHVVGAHPHQTQLKVSQVNFQRDVCIVMGSEGDGLSVATRNACHELAVIPMSKEVDSLNVGTAAAVFLYEALRQKSLVQSACSATV